jgi:hypothetical protein|tara:strand:- start:2076 stop:2951 length:876 start_codon:yes stop_codon:yes gene_type:complete
MKRTQLNNLILEAYAEVISELNEAPDRMFYIKIPKDAASQNKAQVVLEDMYGIKYEINDDPNGVVLYFSVDEYQPGLLDDLEGEQVEILDTNIPQDLNESLLDELSEEEEEEPTPEEEPDADASKETVLEDATDTILAKFPTLRQAIIKLQTEDFKQFVTTIDWISPRPTSFRINLKNGQDYILKWTGKTFEANILGKRYLLSSISDYQQALDKLTILYREAPMKGAGEEGGGDAPADFGSADGGGGADFPGEEGGAEGGEDFGGDDAGADAGGGEDLSGEEIDFEDGEEG